MSQYRLTRPKRRKSKIPFVVTFLAVVLVFGTLGAIFARNWVPPTIPLPKIAAFVVGPTSVVNFSRQKASKCTNGARDQFVKDATRINEVFEDNFVLAGGASRIALAPIVADMQGAAREMKALPVDDCGKVVQKRMTTAYSDAIDMYLEFMKESPGIAGVDSVNGELQNAYRFLFVYQSDISAPFILDDIFAWIKNGDEKISQPPELAYLDAVVNKNSRCDDYDLLSRLTSDSYASSINRYNVSKSLSEMVAKAALTPTPVLCAGAAWLDTPTPTITPTPTVTQTPTPTPTPTPTAVPRTMQFRIDSKNSKDTYSVEYQIGNEKMVVIDNVDMTWEHTFISTRGIQLLFRIIDRDRGDSATCTILVDGKILAQKERGKGDKSVTCKATVPYL